jgi:AP-3 complex subunit beta
VFVASLAVNSSTTAVLSIDFNDTMQPAQFDVCTSSKKFTVNIAAPVGELLRPHTLNEKEFFSLQGNSIDFLGYLE